MRFAIWIVLVSLTAGCDTCGEAPLAVQGICEPRIQVGTQTNVSVVYESDSGPMPVDISGATIGDAAIATVTIGPGLDRLTITGVAVGSTTVELRLHGYDAPVWFPLSVEMDAPSYQCDGRDPPGFDLTNNGPAPSP